MDIHQIVLLCCLCGIGNGFGCDENCERCNSSGGNTCLQCKSDYYKKNGNCFKCIDKCESCSASDTCDQCYNGYYSFNDTTCLQCPINCISCASKWHCTACAVGFYGTKCSYSCQDHCVGGECSQDGCTQGCQLGFYKDRDDTCKACRSNCASCSSSSNCDQCDSGHYKPTYQNSCSKCPYYRCTRCTSSSQCTACRTGYYGVRCSYSCRDHCIDGECTHDRCTRGCKATYFKDHNQICNSCPSVCTNCTSPTHCTSCQTGYYGPTCSYSCQKYCVDGACSHTRCTGGCKEGKYGAMCLHECSDECIDGECTQNGCTKGCRDGYYKDSDNSCKGCQPSCKTCSNGTSCDTCQDGCADDKCTKDGCTNGCKDGYYKDSGSQPECKPCQAPCKTCSRYSCRTCEEGCADGECTSRQCTKGCRAGFYGLTCSHTCQKHCVGGACSSVGCKRGCKAGHYGATCSFSCQEHCVGGDCTQAGCIGGCKDGFYKSNDNVCTTCPSGCISCSSSYNCNRCDVGYYKHANNRYCSRCPSRCNSCMSNTQCSSCRTGYYGATCLHSCQSHCVDGECKLEGCTGRCKDGQYKDSDNVCKRCQHACKTCSDGTSCDTCKDGCADDKCSKDGCTNGCKDGYYNTSNNDICHACQSNCASCSAHGNSINCDQCDYGYYKDRNNRYCRQCSSRCVNCTSYSHCTTCQPGYYGTKCLHSCQEHCVDGDCTIDGCTRGCIDGYYRNNDNICKTCSDSNCASCSSSYICDQCNSGYYKRNGNCQRCPSSCVNCTSSTQCSECLAGYYGIQCSYPCQDHCVDGNCTIDGCTNGCKEGYYKYSMSNVCQKCSFKCTSCSSLTQCSACRAGYYGTACSYACEDHCIDGECTHDECTKGCKDGYYKDQDQQCRSCPYSNCAKCTSSTRCTKCLTGYYGPTCSYSCQYHCIDGECEQDGCTKGCKARYYKDHDQQCLRCPYRCTKCTNSTHCISCYNGLWGNRCDKTCSNDCLSSVCYPDNGRCYECRSDKYGVHCGQNCSVACVRPGNSSNVCRQTDGVCEFGCSAGKAGQECGKESDSATSAWMVAGIAGPVVSVIIIISIAVVFCMKRRQRVIGEGQTTQVEMTEMESTGGVTREQNYMNVDPRGNSGQDREIAQMHTTIPEPSNDTYMGLNLALSRDEHNYGTANLRQDVHENLYVNTQYR